MQINLKYLAIGLFVITIGALLFSGYTYRESDLYKKELNKQYEADKVRFKSELKRSELERNIAVHRADSLYSISKIILARDSAVIDSLKHVPGKFNKLTNKQLQDKMIEEYNKAQ